MRALGMAVLVLTSILLYLVVVLYSLSMIVKRSWSVFFFSVCSSLLSPFPYIFMMFGLAFGSTTTLARHKYLTVGPVVDHSRSVEKALGFASAHTQSCFVLQALPNSFLTFKWVQII